MRRRELIGMAAMASLCPALAWAQQQKSLPVIGVLGAVTPEARQVQLNLAAFREALAETGYVEGQNVAIEYRWAERRIERLPALAAELVARKVECHRYGGWRFVVHRRERRYVNDPDRLSRLD